MMQYFENFYHIATVASVDVYLPTTGKWSVIMVDF